MSRRAFQTLTRAASAVPVGLHAGEITSLPSLIRCITTLSTTITNSPRLFKSLDWYKDVNDLRNATQGWRRSNFHTSPAATATTAAEQYDLLPPDTGVIRIEGYDQENQLPFSRNIYLS